ncbi:MAG TPA: glycerophosphodiester phosphodiesterase family protein [Gammaproteobacteria bacterium]|nr:glycerophosphodiester phosphodiesterase family protein [Gammaproteobacteria bacterium]
MDLYNLNINPPVIAHRGASAYAPENTMAAFQKAKELGARWVEFDVMLTACDEPVIIHDTTLDRTTNAKGEVNKFTNNVLQTLDAGSWFGSQFTGEKIPTLKQLLSFLSENSMSPNIEIKAVVGQEKAAVSNVLEVVANHWPAYLEPPLFSSFSMDILREIRKHSASARLGCLIDSLDAMLWVELDGELNFTSFNLNHTILSHQLVFDLKTLEKPILAYTVNDPQRAKELFSWGVDAVFTDCPDKILELI